MLNLFPKIFKKKREHGGGSLAPSPDARASFNQQGAVFLHLSRGTVFRSNTMGAAIWKRLLGGSQPESIAREIAGDYGVQPERVAGDVARFVARLESEGLLVRNG
jgi:hypothetical protein